MRPWILISIICIAFLLYSCPSRPTSPKPSPDAGAPAAETETDAATDYVPVETATVHTGDIQAQYKATAVFQGWRDIVLSTEIGGTVQAIQVDEGDAVRKDELLIEIDHTQLDAQVLSTQAQLDAARAQLAEISNATRPQQLAQAEAALSQAEAALELADKELARQQQLYEAGVTARAQLDAAEAAHTQAQAAYNAAAEQLSLAKEGARTEQVQAVEAQVRGLEAALAIAQDQRDSALITAPFTGKAAILYVDEHEMIGPGAPLLAIVDDSMMELTVGVDDLTIGRLEVGQELRIEVEALTNFAQGYISSIGVKADEVSGTFPVKLAVENPDGQILSGMVGNAFLPVAAHRDVVIVPRSVLQFSGGKSYVFVVVQERANHRGIETGIDDGTFVEVLSGLEAGEELIVKGQHNVSDGNRILVVNTVEMEMPTVQQDG